MWLGGETMLQKNHTTGSIPDDSKFYLIILIIKFWHNKTNLNSEVNPGRSNRVPGNW